MTFGVRRAVWGMVLGLVAAASAGAARPQCNKCQDLPALEGELIVQEAIYAKVRQYVHNETDYQLIAGSPEALQAILLQTAQDAAGGGDGGGGGNAAPTLTTDVTNKKCRMYVLQNGQRRKFRAKTVRKAYCGPVADYLIAHERQHQKTCKAAWKAGTQDGYTSAEYVANDEMIAYWTGIVSLRKSIAQLARKCGWEDSCARSLGAPTTVVLPDVETVPCHAEILRLQSASAQLARALREVRARE